MATYVQYVINTKVKHLEVTMTKYTQHSQQPHAQQLHRDKISLLISFSPHNESDGSDRGETGDLVPESVHEDGHALCKLLLQAVSQTGHHLAHACDGPLLHLLVYVRCLQPPKSRLIDLQHKWLKVIQNSVWGYRTTYKKNNNIEYYQKTVNTFISTCCV